MMPAGSTHALDLARVNPLLYRGKTDSQLQGRFPQLQQIVAFLARALALHGCQSGML